MIQFIKRHCKARTIRINGEKYLTRYYIFRTRLFGLYLHEFHRGDGDRELHSHPWLFAVAYVLRGGYYEEKLKGSGIFTRYVGRFNFISGGCFHRITQARKGTYTLFFHGPKSKRWGFLTSAPDANSSDLKISFRPYVD